MWDFLIIWSILILCVAASGFAWVRYRSQAARKEEAERVSLEREYAADRKRSMSELLATKLAGRTQIACAGTKFEAIYVPAKDAVWVSNLGVSPYLPSAVFTVAADLLASHGRALKGDAARGKLGSPELPLDSIEGAVANAVFGRVEGDAVFRRITPITGLLVHLRLAEYDGRGDSIDAPGMRVAPSTDAKPVQTPEVLHSGA